MCASIVIWHGLNACVCVCNLEHSQTKQNQFYVVFICIIKTSINHIEAGLCHLVSALENFPEPENQFYGMWDACFIENMTWWLECVCVCSTFKNLNQHKTNSIWFWHAFSRLSQTT